MFVLQAKLFLPQIMLFTKSSIEVATVTTVPCWVLCHQNFEDAEDAEDEETHGLANVDQENIFQNPHTTFQQ